MADTPQFIVIDGGEGSGTTTITEFLADRYKPKCIQTREPGGSPYAEEIRKLILPDGPIIKQFARAADAETMLALFWASRRDHVRHTIAPALAAGKHVLSDRFDSSTWAYQIFAQNGEHLRQFFWSMNDLYLGKTTPSHYILLDVDPEVGLARAKDRGGDTSHFDEQKLEFHELVREGYHNFMARVPHTTVDANQPLEQVKEEVTRIVDPLIR